MTSIFIFPTWEPLREASGRFCVFWLWSIANEDLWTSGPSGNHRCIYEIRYTVSYRITLGTENYSKKKLKMFQHLLNDKKRPQPKIDLTASTHDVQEIGAPTRHSWHGHAPCPSRSFSSASGSLPPSDVSFTVFLAFGKNKPIQRSNLVGWVNTHLEKYHRGSQIGSFLKPLGWELKKSTLKPLTVVINTTS